MTLFEGRKQKILQQLGTPHADYTDASPKGSVDEDVRQLVDDINGLDGFVTTSSCAGRVAVYLEGRRNGMELEPSETREPSTGVNVQSSLAGKGGGQWLFVSHQPVDTACYDQPGALSSKMGLVAGGNSAPAACNVATGRFIHLKFEPMILHILTSSLDNAQYALEAAMRAGFRESGISGVVPSSSSSGALPPAPLVAVRTHGLAFDSIVAYQDAQGNNIPMVTEEYLRTLLTIANQRFELNADRKARFWTALKQILVKVANGGDLTKQRPADWEPATERKARKRAEGLERQRQSKGVATAKHENDHVMYGLNDMPIGVEV
ncbi:hypothetical protein K431DRAFT_285054 [Polychaeton citri CBS 116435]|uniref:tRNA(Phe) 7-[(3-amino-3-carboxypropyl)-4-demethylwyosine(37)-N(4)]-methyltransferase n=1 Tax=Polychaeton citri CBS 116435 TaxID=1314669 RepID=A0A9P4Q7X4_9PEZI|nr:hypothetical protein K431DRAFT_285054 [Polychaeton citri CBS 116435]